MNSVPVCVNLGNVSLFFQLGSVPVCLSQCENVFKGKDKKAPSIQKPPISPVAQLKKWPSGQCIITFFYIIYMYYIVVDKKRKYITFYGRFKSS